MLEKKTKIICTVAGHHCEEEFLRGLYENGMNVMRINSAHVTTEQAQVMVDNCRKVSDKIAILIDTKGPEVRLTAMEGKFSVSTDDILEIHDDPSQMSREGHLYTTYNNLSKDLHVGCSILIDDGLVDLEVISKTKGTLVCKARNNGVIKGRKSVNIPNVHIDLPALTEKDKQFILWAIESGIDFIAHSFVRSADDLKEIQKILDEHNSDLKIISKIENQQGVDNLDEILSHCYGVMVARGDLGVEIPAEYIPSIQRRIVHACRERKKPVIVATQMLQSMIENPRPTRAEVTDVANAIYQGADAIMLSGETASGQYPFEAVQTMTRIALANEGALDIDLELNLRKVVKPMSAVLARSLVSATTELPIKAIIIDTITGRIGRYLSTFRPKVPIYAMCYSERTMRELALVRGVVPMKFDKVKSKEEYVKNSTSILIENGDIQKGDLIGFIGGVYGEQGAAQSATYLEFLQA
ncbi:MAG: pyruvate kinase [Bacteroidales bacterium]|nr:pyruvate kinase [Bacteroidales bacterium]